MKKFSTLFFACLLLCGIQALIAQPNTIPRLAVWYSADSVVLNGGNVSQLIDKSGHGRHANQTNAATQPQFIASIPSLKNNPVVRLNRSELDFMSSDSAVKVVEAYLVLNYTAGSTFQDYDGILTGLVPDPYLIIGEGGTTKLYPPVSTISINGVQTLEFAPLNLFKIVSVKNGSGVNLNKIILGNDRFCCGDRYWGGDVAEVIIFDSLLSASSKNNLLGYLQNKYSAPVSLGPDINMPNLCDTVLHAGPGYKSYKWNGNSSLTDSILVVSKSGTYYVETVDQFGFASTDTITVTYPFNQIPKNNFLCAGSSLIWNTNLDHSYTFLWSDGSSDSLLTISNAGDYWVRVTDGSGCSLVSDTINVVVDDFSQVVSFGTDSISLCAGASIGLASGANRAVTYSWSTGATTSTINILSSGMYYVTVKDTSNCSATDSVYVNVTGIAPTVDFSFDSTCFGNAMQFHDLSVANGGDAINYWKWTFGDPSSGANDSSFIQNPAHLYSDVLTHTVTLLVNTLGGCNNSISKSVSVLPKPVAGFTSSGSCAGIVTQFTNTTNVFGDTSVSYSWSFDDPASGTSDTSTLRNPSHVYSASGVYNVKMVVTLSWGCSDSITIPVTVDAASNCATPDQIPGLQLWFAADKVVQSGGFVSKWLDQSGHGRDAYQNSGTNQPTLTGAINKLNYNPAVRFDGTDDYMLIDSSVKIGEMFVILNFRGGNIFTDYHGVLTGQTTGLILVAEGGTTSFYQGDFGDNIYVNGLKTRNFGPLDRFKLVSAVAPTPSKYPDLQIGMDRGFAGRNWNGDIAEIIVFDDTLSTSDKDILLKYLYKKYTSPVNLGPDLAIGTICSDTLDATDRYYDYRWNKQGYDTVSKFIVKKSGTYTVETIDLFNKHSFDTVVVTYPVQQPLLKNVICYGTAFTWNTGLDHSFTFAWNNGTTDSLIVTDTAGKFFVIITDPLSNCTYQSDTIEVIVDDFGKVASIGPRDTSLCKGNTLRLLSGANRTASYSWTPTNTTDSTIQVDNPGLYTVTVVDSFGCSTIDSINVTIKGVAPTALFSSTKVCPGQQISFINLSSAPPGVTIDTLIWYFGDNTSDSTNNSGPSHLYPDTFNHIVTLFVITSAGCLNSYSDTVHVFPNPHAAFTDSVACKDLITKFFDRTVATGQTITQWQWDFGDSSGFDTNANPTHTYKFSQWYPVNLIVTSDIGCKDTISDSVFVNIAAQPNFSNSSTCWLQTMRFTNLTNIGTTPVWHWDFGDRTSSDDENPSKLYSLPGTYNVTLTAITDSGCVSTITKQVFINPLPNADFDATPACKGSVYSFADKSTLNGCCINKWQWTIPGLTSPDSIKNPTYVFDSLKTYTVKLRVTSDAGCWDTITKQITVYPLPVPNFSFNPAFGGPPLDVHNTNLSSNVSNNTYIWDFGDGSSISTAINPQHLYSDTGKFSIKLIAISPQGCRDSISRLIYVIKPRLDAAVTGLDAKIVKNQLSISATIANLGTLDIDSVIMRASLDDGTSFEESNLQPLPNGAGGTQLYTFVARFDITSPDQLKYYCVSVLHPNGADHDDVESNNTACRNMNNEITVSQPYPNPFSDHLTIDVVVPFNDLLTVELFNAIGQKVRVLLEAHTTFGLNRIDVDLSELAEGMYAIRFTFRDQQIVRQVLKAKPKSN